MLGMAMENAYIIRNVTVLVVFVALVMGSVWYLTTGGAATGSAIEAKAQSTP